MLTFRLLKTFNFFRGNLGCRNKKLSLLLFSLPVSAKLAFKKFKWGISAVF